MNAAEIVDSLFIRQEPVPAPLALVFAAADVDELTRRVRRGAALHRDGMARQLLLSGGGVPGAPRTEAAQMAEIARELGVPAEALLLEEASTNTFENAIFSLELIRERALLDGLDTLLLVSAEWHMRRVLLTVRRAFPTTIRLVCCPTLDGCTARTWRSSESCRRLVESEAATLQAFLDAGILVDASS